MSGVQSYSQARRREVRTHRSDIDRHLHEKDTPHLHSRSVDTVEVQHEDLQSISEDVLVEADASRVLQVRQTVESPDMWHHSCTEHLQEVSERVREDPRTDQVPVFVIIEFDVL